MLHVGLTGGIACGKSTVGEMFARRGAHVIQADRVAHDLMRPGEKAYDDIVAHFGREILNDDGTISRPKLAEAVFSPSATDGAPYLPDVGRCGSSRVAELNRIVHPAVIQFQEDWMTDIGRRDPNAVAMVDAALIYEAFLANHFDKIIVVTCDAEKKAERFSRRTGTTLEFARQEVERRSAAQIPDAEKVARADYVIYNNGPLAETEAAVDKVWRELTQLAATYEHSTEELNDQP